MDYKIFICDDDQEQIKLLERVIQHAQMYLSDEEKVTFELVNESNNFMDAEHFVNTQPMDGGIYFLDIELSDNEQEQSGLDLAEEINRRDRRAQIIFVTSHEDMSIITYRRRLGAIDFIVKTQDESELTKRVVETLGIAIDRLSRENLMKTMTFSYKIGRQIYNVNVDDIYYIRTTTTPRRLEIVTKNRKAEFLGYIRKIAETQPMLAKLSQSCLVNPKNIAEADLTRHQVTFINGEVETFSHTNTRAVMKMMEQNANLRVIRGGFF